MVTAGDIECPADAEIVNPELQLLTLDSPDSDLEQELTAERGVGYSPAEERKDLPIGQIPVDAIYSPIIKVANQVEATRIEHITEDHSLMAEMINDGIITAEQSETHPYRNVILRSIGAYEAVQVDLFSRPLAPDDTIILCSDGLTRLVNNQDLVDIARRYPPAEAARQLINLANERGG